MRRGSALGLLPEMILPFANGAAWCGYRDCRSRRPGELQRATTDNVRRQASARLRPTFQNDLTYKARCDYYLGLKLKQDGSYEEIYNGPGHLIHDRYVIGRELA